MKNSIASLARLVGVLALPLAALACGGEQPKPKCACGHHGGPPPQALEACAGKTPGTACSFAMGDHAMSGVCGEPPASMAGGEAKLMCRPADGPPGHHGGACKCAGHGGHGDHHGKDHHHDHPAPPPGVAAPPPPPPGAAPPPPPSPGVAAPSK